ASHRQSERPPASPPLPAHASRARHVDDLSPAPPPSSSQVDENSVTSTSAHMQHQRPSALAPPPPTYVPGRVTLNAAEPRFAGFTDAREASAGGVTPATTSLIALIRGWRVRRLLACKKLRGIVERIKDTRQLLAAEE